MLPALAAAVGVAVPLAYLLVRGFQAEPGEAIDLAGMVRELMDPVWRTLLLVAGVLVVVTLVAFPAAWLTAWTDLPARRLFALLAIMPLAVPGYVMAYALLGLGGYDGMLTRLLGLGEEGSWLAPWLGTTIPRPSGYLGALLALSAYNLPYMFINLRAALSSVDPSLEEAARSLGHNRWSVMLGVVAPQLRPAYFTGAMLVTLHVIADFGAVSLMRYDTLSRVLYIKYSAFDTQAAARVGLALLAITCLFVAVEMWFLRGLRLDRAGTGMARRRRPVRLGYVKPLAVAFLLAVFFISVVTPTATVIYWLTRTSLETGLWADVGEALWHSASASVPAALIATTLAVPIALLRARYPSRRSFILERLPYIGYATPALAFALSLIVLSVKLLDWTEDTPLFPIADWLYQSMPLLIYAYVLSFLAEAVGPVRSSVYLASPRLEEASQALGVSRLETLWKVTLPLLRNGLIASAALVFLSCMKELPLTKLLAPIGFDTLATNVWTYSEDAVFDQAAPYALVILLFSAGFVGILLLQGRERT